MSRRYYHWLESAVAAKPLRRIIAVTADAERVDITVLALTGDTYAIGDSYAPDDSAGVWSALEDATTLNGAAAIVSYDCPSVWNRVRLWDALRGGTVTLTGLDPRSVQGRREAEREARLAMDDPLAPLSWTEITRAAARNVGCMVLDDPPCIARIRIGASARGVCWMDARNHGVRWAGARRSALDDTLRLTTWIMEYAERLISLGWGPMRNTAGSQALTGYRITDYSGGLFCGSEPRELQSAGESYFGGAVGASQVGLVRDPVWIFDISAAYPAICAGNHVPVRATGYHHYRFAQPCSGKWRPGESIATVRIECDQPTYPIRQDGIVSYPVGRFTATLAGPELTAALARGHIVGVGQVQQYECEPALASYASRLWQLRRTSAGAVSDDTLTSLKMLANVLVGKFGQRDRRWVHCPEQIADVEWGEWRGTDQRGVSSKYRAVQSTVWREEADGWAFDAMPALAAFVTSAQRVRLMEAIDHVGRDAVVYWDTDSVAVTRDCLGALQALQPGQPDGLGQWRLVEGPVEMEIFGLRSYKTTNRTVLAGEAKGGDVEDSRGAAVLRRRAALAALMEGHAPEVHATWQSVTSAGFAGVLKVDKAGRVIVPRLEEW